MSPSAYFGGAIVMILSFMAVFASLLSPIMPHEPMLVVVTIGSVVGVIGGIIFFNELVYSVTGRTIFG